MSLRFTQLFLLPHLVVAAITTMLFSVPAASAQPIATTSSTASPAPSSIAPAVTGTFNLSALPRPQGRERLPALSRAQERERLPGNVPDYFTRIFHSILNTPLPAQVFEQGGIPGIVPEYEVDSDPTGRISSYQPLGATKTATNAFFQSLGLNGRACITCHLPPDAMSVSVNTVVNRWNASGGHDPIFAPIDGADCPNLAAASNPRSAHSLLLNRGLFRIFLAVPPSAEFTVKVISDPNGCNTDPTYADPINLATGKPVQTLSMYRRPRIAGNLPFVVTSRSDVGNAIAPAANPAVASDPIDGQPVAENGVTIDPRTGHAITGNIMWDGREPTLETQAADATQGHAQAPNPPTPTQIGEMVQFELGIFNAQIWDSWSHSLAADGAVGGPVFLSGGVPALQPQTGGETLPLFEAWTGLPSSADRAAERASVARGQTIFQTRTFEISDVAGFNNIAPIGNPAKGTCSSCHNQTYTGNDSFVAAQHDIGIGGTMSPGATVPFPAPSKLLPIFEFTCAAGKSTAYQGTTVVTNDPGMALISGKCADIGRFTVPQLRGLAARAPYFSDGSAATLLDVVNFYNARFSIGLSNQDDQDLVAFLKSL